MMKGEGIFKFPKSSKSEPSEPTKFQQGYEARLRLKLSKGRFGRVEAYFLNELDVGELLVFVEDEQTREHGFVGSVELTCWISGNYALGVYRCRCIKATYLGGGKDGRRILVPPPDIAFEIVDRKWRSGGEKTPVSVTEWSWE